VSQSVDFAVRVVAAPLSKQQKARRMRAQLQVDECDVGRPPPDIATRHCAPGTFPEIPAEQENIYETEYVSYLHAALNLALAASISVCQIPRRHAENVRFVMILTYIQMRPVRISAWAPNILRYVIICLSRSNAGIVPQIKHGRFLPHPCQFIMHAHSLIRRCLI
jgi:hypothetical protein